MSAEKIKTGVLPEKQLKNKSAKKSVFKFPLWLKLSMVTGLMITVLMSSVMVSLYKQQEQLLSQQAMERARAVADNLAVNSQEFMLTNDDLQLAFMVTKAVQPDITILADGYKLTDPGDVVKGLKYALVALVLDFGNFFKKHVNWNFTEIPLWQKLKQAEEKQVGTLENEGILEAYIVDLRRDSLEKGNIIAHNNFSIRGTKYQQPVYLEQARSAYPVYEKLFMDSEGQSKIRQLFHITRNIEIEGDEITVLGQVNLGLDRAIIERVIFQAAMKVLAISIFSLVLGGLFTLLIVRYLVRPIAKLVRGVLAIAGGNFDTRVRIQSSDELGQLTYAFNDMARSLSENETLKGAFSRYVSDAALKQLLSDPSKTGLHSRRTVATVYSSDVRGFTAMSESLQPEEVVAVINFYLSMQTEIILEYGGVVDKFIGDATIGVWGKEEAKDDDALNCIKSALKIQEKIAQINVEREKKGEVAKMIGIGINTGDMISGNMGSSKKMEYTIAGDNAVIADKICDECPGGKVWITETTLNQVKDKIVYEAKEPLQLKGRINPVPVFEVLGLKNN
jgi:class 3 adenylate cyclase